MRIREPTVRIQPQMPTSASSASAGMKGEQSLAILETLLAMCGRIGREGPRHVGNSQLDSNPRRYHGRVSQPRPSDTSCKNSSPKVRRSLDFIFVERPRRGSFSITVTFRGSFVFAAHCTVGYTLREAVAGLHKIPRQLDDEAHSNEILDTQAHKLNKLLTAIGKRRPLRNSRSARTLVRIQPGCQQEIPDETPNGIRLPESLPP